MSYLSDNPFTECTARDMGYHEVSNYWCQPYEFYDGLNETALIHSTTPIFIEGARGSGKTMILKHLSFFCQRNEHQDIVETSILDYFATNESIGIYYRFKNDFGKLLSALKCHEELRNDVFFEYFQLYYSRELVSVLDDLYDNSALSSNQSYDIIMDLNSLFGISSLSFPELQKCINHRIEMIDAFIRRLKYMGNISEEFSAIITGETYINKILAIIRRRIVEWNKITLMILIDEYENISAFQKTVNTLIKQTEASTGITYRIGMRPESTVYETYVGNEQLQNGRDFILMQLRVTKPKSFQRFLKIVAKKRLEKSAFFSSHRLTRIEKILGFRENWIEEAKNATKNRPDILFEYISNNNIEKYGIETIKEQLAYPDNPLIEMQNIRWLNRGKPLEYTREAMESYLEAKKTHKTTDLVDGGYKYYLDFDMKYKYSLLFIVLRKCGQRKKYYSFTTFSYLSNGSVNDFLSLCRNTFMAIDKNGYDELLAGRPLPIDIQNQGALEAASEQLDKIRLCEDSGAEMYTFVMNIGDVFRYYHCDTGITFPETNQFAFENEAELYSRHLLKRDLDYMLKWGVVEKKGQRQRISIGKRKGNIYVLNKLFAPFFEISYRTRGGYNFVIKTETFEQMLSNSMDAQDIISVNKKRLTREKKETTGKQNPNGQMCLFEEE